MTLQIRAAQMTDIPAARAIQNVLFPGHHYDYARNFVAHATRNFVALRDGRVVGFTSGLIGPIDSDGPAFWQRAPLYVAFVGVDQREQSHGVGSALLATVCDALFAASLAPHVYLECERSEASFYEKNGFVEVQEGIVEREFAAGLRMRIPFRRQRSA